MAIGLIIPSNGSFCGYFAIASSILCQTAEERDKCLAKITIVKRDIYNLSKTKEFQEFDQETKNKIQELSAINTEDEFQEKLKKLFDETPLQKAVGNMSFTTSDGRCDSQMPNYNIATPVKILGALIRHQIQNNFNFKINVKEQASDKYGFMKDEDGAADKFDNIGYGDLATLFKFFHEKDFSCETHPTNQIIMNLQSTDLQNQNCNFSIIFDASEPESDQGHYNAIFSSEKYKEREKEFTSQVTDQADQADQADQENNNFCHNLKNLSKSILHLILTSCNKSEKLQNNFENVSENFNKLMQNIIPCTSPRNPSKKQQSKEL
jgi:hypothetical protein